MAKVMTKAGFEVEVIGQVVANSRVMFIVELPHAMYHHNGDRVVLFKNILLPGSDLVLDNGIPPADVVR